SWGRHLDKRCLAAVPGGYGTVQIGKNEASGRVIAAHPYRERVGVCIGDLTGRALGSACRLWDEDIAVGPHRGRFRDGIAGRHRVGGCGINRWGWEGWIDTLVRNPKRARGIVGNTPRVMQGWVSEGGEPRDIRNQICLSK